MPPPPADEPTGGRLDQDELRRWVAELVSVTGWWTEPRLDGEGLADARIFLPGGCWHAVADADTYRYDLFDEGQAEQETTASTKRYDKPILGRSDLGRFGFADELPEGPWTLTTWSARGRCVAWSLIRNEVSP